MLRPVGGGKVAQRLYGDGREEGSGKAHLSPVVRLAELRRINGKLYVSFFVVLRGDGFWLDGCWLSLAG